jgi:hypothetical protein
MGAQESYDQAFPDLDTPPIVFDSDQRSAQDFQGLQGHEADFGYSTMKIPERRALGSHYRNPLASRPIAAPAAPLQGVGEIASIFNSVKWVALVGAAIFGYYKLKEHKSELKGMVSTATDAARAARAAVTKSNPTAAERWLTEKSDEEADDVGLSHRHESDDEDEE